MTSVKQYDVFLSHNRSDAQAVEILARRLREEARLRPFLDRWHLIPGEPWQEAIEVALAESETVAVFVGPSGISPWHNEEMRAALDDAVRSRDEVRVIPVLLPGADEASVRGFLARRTWADFRAGLDDAEAFARLVAGIQGEAVGVGTYELPAEPAPYRGLLRFEAEHSRFFFGRSEERRRLVDKLGQQPFVAVVGASGSGKSSLVRAGVLPDLAADALPDSRQWHVLTFTPGSQPLRSLASQLATLAPATVDRLQTADQLVQRLAERTDGLRTAVMAYLVDARPLLLFVDQFEELFTHCRESIERCRVQAECFIANLADAVEQGDRQIRVLITLRADFLDRCLPFPVLRELLEDRQVLLGPMDEPALREAIVRPAQEVGALFEKGLVSLILRDVLAKPGALPLLEHALHELWLARRSPWLTVDAYEASGGVQGALQRRAQATYEALSQGQQPIARNVLLRLTALGEGVADTRRRVERGELYPVGVEPGQVDAVLQALSGPEARLVVADEESVEVAHEALIQGWDTLRGWLEENREGLRLHRHLTESAEEWESLGRDEGELYRGARLAQVEEWAETHAGELNPLEQAFLESSQTLRDREAAEAEAQRQHELAQARALAQEERRRADIERKLAATERDRAAEQSRTAQRLRWLSVGLGLVALLALISAGWAVSQSIRVQRQARITRAGDLAAHAQTALEQYPQRSLLLAAEAVAVTSKVNQPVVPIAENVFKQVLMSTGGRTLTRHWSGVSSVGVTADAAWLISGGGGSTVYLRRLAPSECKPNVFVDATAYDRLALPVGDQVPMFLVTKVVVSPDGQWLFTVSADITQDSSVILRWDLADLVADCDRLAAWNSVAADREERQQALPPSLAGARAMPMGPQPIPESYFYGQEKQVTAMAVSQDSRWLILGNQDGTVQFLVLTSASASTPYRPQLSQGHQGAIHVMAVSSDGRWLVTGSTDHTARLWNLRAIDPSTEFTRLAGHWDAILSAAISADGRWLVTGSADDTARLWDLQASDVAAHSVVLSGHNGDVTAVAISPDNAWIVTGSDDGTARLWDLTAADPSARPLVLSGHTDTITTLAISPDSRWLATGSLDATLRLWDLAARDPSAASIVLRGHEGAVNMAFMSRDGKALYTGSEDGSTRVWDLTSPEPGAALSALTTSLTLSELIDLACDTAGRNLTQEEWDLYFPGQEYRQTCEQ